MSFATRIYVCTIVVILVAGCVSETELWKSTTNEGTDSSYAHFIEMFPNSEYAPEARKRLEILRWEEAKAKDTDYCYIQFLHDYPNGLYSSEAKTKLNTRAKITASLPNKISPPYTLTFTETRGVMAWIDSVGALGFEIEELPQGFTAFEFRYRWPELILDPPLQVSPHGSQTLILNYYRSNIGLHIFFKGHDAYKNEFEGEVNKIIP